MAQPGQWMGWQSLRDDLRIAGAGTGAALALALLVSLGQLDRVPAHLPIALLTLTALASWRPDLGLVVLAFAIPLASWAGRDWNYYVAWAEALVVAFAAGWFLRGVFLRARDRDELDPPVQVGAVVVIASLLVGIGVMNWRLTGQLLTLDFLEMAGSQYFVVKSSADALDTAMRLLESLVLFRAAAACAGALPAFTPMLVKSLVSGAALAGVLNVWRLWEVAQRAESPLAAFIGHLATVRENIHYTDLNAAGSFFVLAFFAAVGVARLPRHWTWIPPSAAIAAALWLTGSRTALVAGLLAALAPLARRAWLTRPRRARITLGVAGLILVATAGAAARYLPQRGTQRSSLDALQVRWELARTSLRMTAAYPAFGTGVGQYYNLSGTYSSPELLQLFPPAQNENAHNNFLQILAELGVVGFAAFVWLLVIAARRIAVGLKDDANNPLRWGLATGLLAFVLTWLGGHPLLVDEPAFSFWILLGAAAGWAGTLERAVAAGWTPSRALVTAAVIALLVGVPARARGLMAQADMEHAGFGLSQWQPEVDGVRYRLSAGRSTVFLPGDARSVAVRLRPVEPGRTLEVLLSLDGHPADAIRVPPGKWHELRLLLPQAGQRGRFRRLNLDVSGAPPTGPFLLMVGKVEPR